MFLVNLYVWPDNDVPSHKVGSLRVLDAPRSESGLVDHEVRLYDQQLGVVASGHVDDYPEQSPSVLDLVARALQELGVRTSADNPPAGFMQPFKDARAHLSVRSAAGNHGAFCAGVAIEPTNPVFTEEYVLTVDGEDGSTRQVVARYSPRRFDPWELALTALTSHLSSTASWPAVPESSSAAEAPQNHLSLARMPVLLRARFSTWLSTQATRPRSTDEWAAAFARYQAARASGWFVQAAWNTKKERCEQGGAARESTGGQA